ncbi:helix-turn-helix domain-containing protein [Cryobacterium sp. PAMC25264]|uniref:winged helix-turn-helix transcriptional regulator n=1 Tax=Cryobacterium sp. PAMC25264 TaxID=2861288 RepID=UPI001C637B24|nr:helix-turn-helix domain-containing protein [Cryobacterium sp. PAMC25264]QYF72310.1 helix-turn-helix transcriptional regulator [Cryobacterium sp. PAMC25264]
MTALPAETNVTLDPDSDALCREPSSRALVRDVFSLTSDKWSMSVIRALTAGPVRFTHLMVDIPGISHRMLTRTLRALERDGLVSRTSYPESPPRVEYELTVLGTTLSEPVRAFIDWTHRHRSEIEESRARFDG